MAKPDPAKASPRLLAVELWGIGDVALAVPFLRLAAQFSAVTLLAKPHAAPLLRRFAPQVHLVPLVAPWTAFRHKYRLHQWPWATLISVRRALRTGGFHTAVSARPDPRDHLILAASGARRRLGFARTGSGVLLTDRLAPPVHLHRVEYWRALAQQLGYGWPALPARRSGPLRRLVLHPGAGQPVRRWPLERFQALAQHLRAAGHEVRLLSDEGGSLDSLLDDLAAADGFIGNDSGPGHLAALLDVPTFTLFGPQVPAHFHPVHPRAEWIEGAPCPHRPCFDACRYAQPHCLLDLEPERVATRVLAWAADGGVTATRAEP